MDKTPGEESVLGTADKGRTHSARKCIDLQDSDKNQMDTYSWQTGDKNHHTSIYVGHWIL